MAESADNDLEEQVQCIKERSSVAYFFFRIHIATILRAGIITAWTRKFLILRDRVCNCKMCWDAVTRQDRF